MGDPTKSNDEVRQSHFHSRFVFKNLPNHANKARPGTRQLSSSLKGHVPTDNHLSSQTYPPGKKGKSSVVSTILTNYNPFATKEIMQIQPDFIHVFLRYASPLLWKGISCRLSFPPKASFPSFISRALLNNSDSQRTTRTCRHLVSIIIQPFWAFLIVLRG